MSVEVNIEQLYMDICEALRHENDAGTKVAGLCANDRDAGRRISHIRNHGTWWSSDMRVQWVYCSEGAKSEILEMAKSFSPVMRATKTDEVTLRLKAETDTYGVTRHKCIKSFAMERMGCCSKYPDYGLKHAIVIKSSSRPTEEYQLVRSSANGAAVYGKYPSDKDKTNILLFYPDGIMCHGMGVKRQGYIPATLSLIAGFWLPPSVLEVILRAYSGTSKLYLDLLRDDYYPKHLAVADLSRIYTKKQMFEELFKMLLPSRCNRIHSKELFAKCCAAKYIDKAQIGTLFASPTKISIHWMDLGIRRRKEVAQEYIANMLCERNVRLDSTVCRDYVHMIFKSKKPIVDISKGARAIEREHDRLAAERAVVKMRVKEIEIPDGPLKYIKLPDWFTLLDTRQKLYDEGDRNANCVCSYDDYINEGRCVIYAADYKKEHMTVEIQADTKNNQLLVAQCLTFGNREPSEKAFEAVQHAVSEASADAFEWVGRGQKPAR